MPRKPLNACRYPGCTNRCVGQYCEKHAAIVAKEYNKNSRSKDHNKRYGRQWKKIRNAYASAHPLCERCLKEGKLVPMEEVHHILPINRGGGNNWSNLMSLCHSCHEKIHKALGDR